jgi:hypothetical protein
LGAAGAAGVVAVFVALGVVAVPRAGVFGTAVVGEFEPEVAIRTSPVAPAAIATIVNAAGMPGMRRPP